MTRITPIKRWSSADINAAIERVAPDVLALLGDGVPRAEAAIVAALAGRHPRTRSSSRSCASTSSAGSTCRAAATPYRRPRRSRGEPAAGPTFDYVTAWNRRPDIGRYGLRQGSAISVMVATPRFRDGRRPQARHRW
jgi:hypothetical protein